MFIILILVNLLCCICAQEVTFHYNNTYKYGVTYTVNVSKTDEYILEFGGDQEVYDAPARVTVASVNNNISYPVFITARQQKGVLSWQLPMTVATPGGTVEFRNVSRTLCPHNNIFNPPELACDATTMTTPIIYLSTSNVEKIAVDIRVEEVRHFYVKLNDDFNDRTTNISLIKHNYNLTISPSEPMYYFYSFDQHQNLSLDVLKIQNKLACNQPLTPAEQTGMNVFLNQTESRDWLSRRDGLIERSDWPDSRTNEGGGWFWRPRSVILMIESQDDICAVVSIQNFSCPVFDNERDILYDGQYLTMTRAGGITLTEEQFPQGFYIVFIVKSSDEDCLQKSPIKTANTSNLESYLNWYGGETIQVIGENGRSKTFTFAVVATISYTEYITASSLVFAFYLCFYLAFFLSTCICRRRKNTQAAAASENGGCEEDPSSPDVAHEGSSTSTALATDGEAGAPELRARAARRRRRDDTISPVSTASVSSADSELSVLARDAEKEALLPPASPPRLASLARVRGDVLSARSDLFKWSVITVAVFYTLPVVQLVITYQRLLNQSGNQDLCYYNFLCAHPLGWLSDYNHVYSNIGYVMLGALFLLQVYRRRRHYRCRARHEKELGIPQHFGLLYAMGIALVSEGLLSGSYHVCPNDMNFQFDTSFMYVTAVLCMVKIYQSRHPDINASAHSTFGVLALIILIGLVGVLNASLWFWILFTMLHLVTCFVLTFKIYYFGRLTFNFGMIWRAVKGLMLTPLESMTPTYCSRMILLIVANLINWALAGYGMYQHKMDFASHLLVVMMGNLFMYTNFYVLMKLAYRESLRAHTWLFFLLTHTTWYTAAYFFLQQSTSWSLAPAQSRRYNQECSLLQLYDSHDIWHMLSAVAMFFSFNMYLTIDDNLSRTPRDDIMVF